MDSLARQIQELSLQVAELDKERNSLATNDIVLTAGESHSRSRNRKSGQKFLVDSGSEICVILPSPTMNKSPQSNFSLFAANNAKDSAYGMVRKELNLGLRRPFIWTFIIC
ncbi:hypothetical protein TNCV_1567371 [Trichonephila clavipes]|nr:hypothetical protein TNCV_1567371 [Trichonephila clavipes]